MLMPSKAAPPLRKITTRYDLTCPMRDGLDLSTDVYMPAEGGPFPVLLNRNPYNNNLDRYVVDALYLAQRGYAAVIQYDPSRPVPTLGGSTCCSEDVVPISMGPRDQRPAEWRPDVLVYSSPVLEADVEVTGPVRVVLYAASTARDTDFTAKLVDVFPGGYAMNAAQGILRARYRDSWEHPTLLEPGRIYAYTIDLWSTSNGFLKGHRIRVEISSSNFPQFDRNPNTGHPVGQDAELLVARQTVHHDAEHPSHIVLPIIP